MKKDSYDHRGRDRLQRVIAGGAAAARVEAGRTAAGCAAACSLTCCGMDSPAAALMERLGLSDEELCEVLDVDPLAVITNELDHRAELGILLALTAETADRVGGTILRSWLRRSGPTGVPLDHLKARDFEAFEDALAVLAERGYVLRSP